MLKKSSVEEIQLLKKYIQRLDSEIELMFPWGELDITKAEQLRTQGTDLRFWTMDHKKFHLELQRSMDPTIPHWMSIYKAHPVSDAQSLSFFTTQTPLGTDINIPFANPARMCPSPVSTLIILQTKAKDKLKQLTE